LKRCSVIDIGTNSILFLTVGKKNGNRLYPVSQKQYNVRLGKGVEENRNIENGVLDHCIEVLQVLKKTAQEQQSDKLIVVGTEVFRKAENRIQILNKIRDDTGLDVHILSEKEEAEASYTGAVKGNTITGECCVIDVGGGSSEIICGHNREVKNFISLPSGAVGLTEKFIHSDPPGIQEISSLENWIETELDQYSFSALPFSNKLIGVGGTITTAATVYFNLKHYDPEVIQGKELKFSDIESLLKRLSQVTLLKRKKMLRFDPERADIIIAGMEIVKVIMNKGNFPSIIVSDLGLRFGLAVKELIS